MGRLPCEAVRLKHTFSRSATRFLDHMELIVLPAAPSQSKRITVILCPDEKEKAEAPWRGVINDNMTTSSDTVALVQLV